MRGSNPAVAYRYAKDKVLTDGKWNGQVQICSQRVLHEPLQSKKPSVYALWNDLLHPKVPFRHVLDVLNVICDERCKSDLFILLTKRPERWPEFVYWINENAAGDHPFCVALEVLGKIPNLIFGATGGFQESADIRVPHVLRAHGVGYRAISIEPMLGPVDLTKAGRNGLGLVGNALAMPSMSGPSRSFGNRLDLVIIGCESGPRRRPMELDWARDVVEQCRAAGIACFVKQLDINGRVSKDMDAWPPDLRVRQMPGEG